MIRYIRTFQIVLATASIATASIATAGLAAAALTPGDVATAAVAPMANDFKPFTAEAFKAATQAGKTTLVFFHAPWCPVCKAQEPKVLAHLNGDHKDIVAFKVDYDTSLGLRKEMKVDKQSTIILYQGATEIARLSYKSDTPSIDELFSHAPMAMSGAK